MILKHVKFTILILLIGLLMLPVKSAMGQSASGYYRKVAAEQRKIFSKQYRLCETMIAYTDARRLKKVREMMVDQLKSSKLNVGRMSGFKKDSTFRNDYLRMLDHSLEHYGDPWDSLIRFRADLLNHPENAEKYLSRLNRWMGAISDLSDDWARNEQYFASTYHTKAMEDKEAQKAALGSSVALYTEDLRMTFVELPNHLKALQDSLRAKRYDLLDAMRLDLVSYLDKALEDVKKIGSFQLEENTPPKADPAALNNETAALLNDYKDAAEEAFALLLKDIDYGICSGDQDWLDKKATKLDQIINYLLTKDEAFNAAAEQFLNSLAA